jgi:hypothetical protein
MLTLTKGTEKDVNILSLREKDNQLWFTRFQLKFDFSQFSGKIATSMIYSAEYNMIIVNFVDKGPDGKCRLFQILPSNLMVIQSLDYDCITYSASSTFSKMEFKNSFT